MVEYSTSTETSPGSGFRIPPKLIVTAIIAVLTVVFIFQNRDELELRIIFFTLTMRLWVAFFVLLIIGAVIGWVLKGIRIKRKAANG